MDLLSRRRIGKELRRLLMSFDVQCVDCIGSQAAYGALHDTRVPSRPCLAKGPICHDCVCVCVGVVVILSREEYGQSSKTSYVIPSSKLYPCLEVYRLNVEFF
eukprot:3186611-Amphidinium_carterae.2